MANFWGVPILTDIFPNARDVNPILSRVFQAIRVADLHGDSKDSKRFYASHDALIDKIDIPEFTELIQFFASSIQSNLKDVNRLVWPNGKIPLQLRIMGCWFQIQNGMSFHDVHTHGNCSWSGVYYVQIDPAPKRHQHSVLAKLNGVTRFYGPYTQWQSGAYMDFGNAYLQNNVIDIEPEVGKLVLFPSYLPHMAMPYEGDLDRIIISFNAQVHSPNGNQIFKYDSK